MGSKAKSKSVSTILLALAIPSFAAGSDLLPPLDPSCGGAFAILAEAKTLALPDVSTRISPDLHAFNYDKLLDDFKKLEQVRFRIKRDKKDPSGTMICTGYPQPHFCFLLGSPLPGQPGKFALKLRTPDGEIYTGPARIRHGSLGTVEAEFKRFKKVEPLLADWKAAKETAHSAYQALEIEKMNADELGKLLSSRQLKNSKNASEAEGEKKRIFQKSIEDGNALLASRLKAQEPLTSNDLDLLNFFSNNGINPYGDSALSPVAGVARGTKNRTILQDSSLYRVDLNDVQVSQGWKNESILEFLPAREVPARLGKLLSGVNKIGPASNPLDIFTLYRTFIKIHPYMDGNGRTARMLLNYMLLKAKMAPSPKALQSLNFSSEEIFDEYLKAIER